MPKAKLPTNLKGWVAAILSSIVGFMAGFVVLAFLEKKWK